MKPKFSHRDNPEWLEDLLPGDCIFLPESCPASHWGICRIWYDELGEAAIDVIEVYREGDAVSARTSILPWERKLVIKSRSDKR